MPNIESSELIKLEWQSVPRATTVAACLRDIGEWSLDSTAVRFDERDWWFRKEFDREDFNGPATLGFDGLATVCDVWLNGRHVLTSESMFLRHTVALEGLEERNELLIRCHSLDNLLKQKRPRPRWRAPMIENQQLRWFRTTLLGRTPGWSPPAAPVGPWRDIWIEQARFQSPGRDALRTEFLNGTGIVRLAFDAAPSDDPIESGELIVSRGSYKRSAKLTRDGSSGFASALDIVDPVLWWPHTHGEPALYAVTLALRFSSGGHSDIDLGKVGFRTIEVDRENGHFAVKVNGVPVFCRGVCWTPLDPVSLRSDPSSYSETFKLLQQAGMNMVRVGGTMTYEQDEFFDACDEHGVLLWQEFMFANMDYPADDAHFAELVRREVTQELSRIRHHPCIAVICGNSEVEQQAAMWGAVRTLWSPSLFHDVLARLSEELLPGVAYWPSSAHGGSIPHEPARGTTSYYGVGAYLRRPEDARLSNVRFASECLAFANIPTDEGISQMPNGHALKQHHPGWKARTPRDLGAGWDFEDVRDHYLEELFGIQARQLRYSDHDRYLELSRVVTGEVMVAAFAEWRRSDSKCHGALVWFMKDLWHGAGWGILDASLAPKPAYYHLRRALQPICVAITNEGCNGLALHLTNESPKTHQATIEVTLFQHGEIRVSSVSRDVILSSHSAHTIELGTLFDVFVDSSYAYRFGPPTHDVVVAKLLSPAGELLADTVHLPLGLARPRDSSLGLSATVTAVDSTSAIVEVNTKRFAQSVALEVPGWRCEDNYFHVPPLATRKILFHASRPGAVFRGTARALNGIAPVQISQTNS